MWSDTSIPLEYCSCATILLGWKFNWQIANNNTNNGQDHNNNSNTITTGDDRTRLQALSLTNDCYKYIMNLTTNGVVITDAIKFVQINKEKLSFAKEEENGRV